MRLWNRSLLFEIMKLTGVFYLSPSNTSYAWNFGFLAMVFLGLQIITGVVLAMFYNPSAELAYEVIMYINNEVYYGWWIRLLHANGASWFFFVVYIHMFRSLYYGSFCYPRQALWISGVIIWVTMIATAFLGYVLPWGQMSFWAAMVITNLLSALPLIGADLIYLLWGGFSITDASLHRFYSLHFCLPFVLLFLSIIHIAFLHEYGSNNPTGIINRSDLIPFMPYFIIKDLFGMIFVLIAVFIIIFVIPDWLGHPDNFIKANPLVTPAHIVPEWYFLPLYAVLRSVTHKLLGITLLALSILVLIILPYLCRYQLVRSSSFRPLSGVAFWFFVVNSLLLGWIGGLPVDDPYLFLGQLFTCLHFVILGVIYPLLTLIELIVYQTLIERQYNSLDSND
jgi:quinol-cytochrome oxidoreductase complex cytochrome b subunit